MNGEVRRVKPGDANDMDELFRRSWLEGFGDILDVEDQENIREGRCVTEDDIEDRRRQDGILTLVYSRDGTVLGQGRIAWSSSTTKSYTRVDRGEVELRSMYVHPKHWNEGIGSEIMEELVKRCPVEPTALKVETYEGSDAVEFYKSKRFEVVRHSTIEAGGSGTSRECGTIILERRIHNDP